MTTKTPSPVKPASDAAQERVAYAAVEGLAPAGSHDLDRLGYCVWLWLSSRRDSLEEAVKNSGVALSMTVPEAVKMIGQRLQERGVTL